MGENNGDFGYLDCLEEKTLANGLLVEYGSEYSINLREKTLAIGHQFAKFTNIFSPQRFPLYGTSSWHFSMRH